MSLTDIMRQLGQRLGHQALTTSCPASVVDDDPLCLKVIEQMLKRCNYEVTTCPNATTALDLLRSKGTEFDLVLSDVYMPDMDGFKLLETVGLELDLPVIMMSSNGETGTVLRGVTHGAVDFLIKPVRIEELRNMWQHVLRRRKDTMTLTDGDDVVMSPEDGDEVTRKRKDHGDEASGEAREDDGSTAKKPRVVWSVEMHQKFVAAVNQLGIDKAVPKKILELMGVEGLTRENVASHLQKYRLYLRKAAGVEMSIQPRGKATTNVQQHAQPQQQAAAAQPPHAPAAAAGTAAAAAAAAGPGALRPPSDPAAAAAAAAAAALAAAAAAVPVTAPGAAAAPAANGKAPVGLPGFPGPPPAAGALPDALQPPFPNMMAAAQQMQLAMAGAAGMNLASMMGMAHPMMQLPGMPRLPGSMPLPGVGGAPGQVNPLQAMLQNMGLGAMPGAGRPSTALPQLPQLQAMAAAAGLDPVITGMLGNLLAQQQQQQQQAAAAAAMAGLQQQLQQQQQQQQQQASAPAAGQAVQQPPPQLDVETSQHPALSEPLPSLSDGGQGGSALGDMSILHDPAFDDLAASMQGVDMSGPCLMDATDLSSLFSDPPDADVNGIVPSDAQPDDGSSIEQIYDIFMKS